MTDVGDVLEPVIDVAAHDPAARLLPAEPWAGSRIGTPYEITER